MTVADVVQAMQGYYARRAAEYERVYHKPERQAELRAIEAWIGPRFAGRDVLEIASGTGWWLPHASASARAWLATDLNEETLAVARAKALPGCVRFPTLDAYDLDGLPPGRRFDAVLLDAPCSSTGTLRRHPDVAWTKSPQDVEALAKLQAQLVGKAAALVKPGGRMVYSNCSLLKQEGENLVAGLLPSLGLQIEALREDEIAGTGGMINGQGALRTLPHHLPASAGTPGGIDGFFACRIRIPV